MLSQYTHSSVTANTTDDGSILVVMLHVTGYVTLVAALIVTLVTPEDFPQHTSAFVCLQRVIRFVHFIAVLTHIDIQFVFGLNVILQVFPVHILLFAEVTREAFYLKTSVWNSVCTFCIYCKCSEWCFRIQCCTVINWTGDNLWYQ